MSESWFDPESPEHPFERVSWHMIGEYGPICRWCGLLREVHDGLIDPPKEEEKVSDRLNEAIKWCQDRLAQQPNADDEWRDVVAAARAYADLVNGERVEARKQLLDGRFRWLVEVPGPGDWLLIDPPKEEE